MLDRDAPALTGELDDAFARTGLGARIETCWDREALLCPGILDDAAIGAFRPACIDDAIRRSEVLRARTEVIEQGKRLPWTRFGCDGTPSPLAVETALERGLTILVRRFDLGHPASAAFARSLEALIGLPVFGTMFITPRRDRAFPAHYDSANVLALQLAGVKRWTLFEQAAPLPLSDADVKPLPVPPASASASHDLAAGDLLYVPRGLVHEVGAISWPSYHISFGVLARAEGLPR